MVKSSNVFKRCRCRFRGTDIAFSLASEYNAEFMQIDSVCGHLQADADTRFTENLSELRAQYPVFLLGGGRFNRFRNKYLRMLNDK